MLRRLHNRFWRAKGTALVGGTRANNRARFRFRLIPGLPVAVFVVLAFTAIFASALTKYDPTVAALIDSMESPSLTGGDTDHLLGTDLFGRDILSRLLHGTRIVLAVVGSVIFISTIVGVALGLYAGYTGGFWDAVIMRTVDITLSFPPILIGIVIAVTYEPSFTNVVVVISIFYWAMTARQIRAEALALKELDFVTYARIAGSSNIRIMYKHILPNVVPTILVFATLQVGIVILFEASLSFLGVGIPPPSPSWGVMIKDGREVIASAWWVSVFPGLAIVITVLATNSFGDWLRDRWDPRLQHL